MTAHLPLLCFTQIESNARQSMINRKMGTKMLNSAEHNWVRAAAGPQNTGALSTADRGRRKVLFTRNFWTTRRRERTPRGAFLRQPGRRFLLCHRPGSLKQLLCF
jgi:hypothetical protein